MRKLWLLSFLGSVAAAAPMGPTLTEAHNRLRAKHCAPPPKWSAKFAAPAPEWGDHVERPGRRPEHRRAPDLR